MTILVLVLGARRLPYPLLMHVIGRTWAATEVSGVETLQYRGGASLKVDRRRLDVPVPDDLANVGRKTIACFEHVLAHRPFDLVFRTNCSSYVDLPNLRAYALARARPHRFYAGFLGGAPGGKRFASGSGYFLSRDLVELVVRQQDEWDHAVLDDVALGKLLAANGVRPDPAPRRDYATVGAVGDLDTSQFHFRCRTDSWGRLGDARIMLALHRAFCEARGLPVGAEVNALGALARLIARGSTSS